MAVINPLIDLTAPVTRQDLFDMWDGALSGIGLSDFAEGFIPIVAASSFSSAPPSPQPGQLLWHLSENVMYLWHDEIEGTGVSLWLAIGPDKFETACIAAEPIAAGHATELLYDRWVRHDRTHLGENTIRGMPRTLGMNQSGIDNPIEANDPRVDDSGATFWGGDTAASGSWIRVGVDGLLYGALESQSSHPTEVWFSGTQGEFVFLSDTTDRDSTLLVGAGEPLAFNVLGMTTEWFGDAAANAPTEPTQIKKFIFSPRVARQSYFAD